MRGRDKVIRRFRCPVCGEPSVTRWHVAGHAGGRTTGRVKARTHAQARRAGLAGAAAKRLNKVIAAVGL